MAMDGRPIDEIRGVFKSFGYTPTDAEVQAFNEAFGEGRSGFAAGTSVVAQYVNFKNQEAQRMASDPLTGLQTRMNNIIDQNTKSVTGLSQQLQDTLSAAPQLFGSMTPDQIGEYLKPLQTSFNTQMSQVQSTLASRGLGASSTEANALAQTNQQFQEQVLNTGLNIGMTSQKNKADALQQQINNLFGQTSQAMGITGGAAEKQSSQNLGQSNLIASLPSFLTAQSDQQQAFNKSMEPQGGFQNTFNQVTGDINQGVGAAGKLYAAYATAGGSTMFNSYNQGSPNSPTGASTSGVPSNSYKAPNLNASGYNQYGVDPVTGRPTNAQFE
jgi:hypothetical protein